MNQENYSIILFDGVCNFCNYWVNFLIDRDKKNCFKFAALQSEKGRELLEKYNLPTNDFDSFILISSPKVYKKS
jgi:predicted DCC family thiol-disulfide oxidoreductase YuxK